MWGWFFWQGLETMRLGAQGPGPRAASSGNIPSSVVIPGQMRSICVTDSVGSDFGTSRVNTDTGAPWDCSVGQGHPHKTQGLGP